jgi:hypothetical protein
MHRDYLVRTHSNEFSLHGTTSSISVIREDAMFESLNIGILNLIVVEWSVA